MKNNNLTIAITASLLPVLALVLGPLVAGGSTLLDKIMSALYWKFNIAPFYFTFDVDDLIATIIILMVAFYGTATFLSWILYKRYKTGSISSRYVTYPAITLVCSLAFLGVIFSSVGEARTSAAVKTAICPDDYASEQDQVAATDAWTNIFYDSHPGASLGDWARARHQFYIDNNCTAALQRYNETTNSK